MARGSINLVLLPQPGAHGSSARGGVRISHGSGGHLTCFLSDRTEWDVGMLLSNGRAAGMFHPFGAKPNSQGAKID
jgi:hypothetical protein